MMLARFTSSLRAFLWSRLVAGPGNLGRPDQEPVPRGQAEGGGRRGPVEDHGGLTGGVDDDTQLAGGQVREGGGPSGAGGATGALAAVGRLDGEPGAEPVHLGGPGGEG